MRKLAGNLNRTQTLCIFTNQIREKVGVMFGSPETQPGGRALKFYASQRLDIRRIETLKDGTEAVGNRVRVKVVKNKVAAPFRQAEFDIEFGKGISTSGCLLDLGIEHNIVTKSGSFFSYGDERLGQGRNNAKALPRRAPRDRQGDRGQDLRRARASSRDLVTPIERDERRGADGRGRRPVRRRSSAAERVAAARARRSTTASALQHALDLAYRYLEPARAHGGRDAPRTSSARASSRTRSTRRVAELQRAGLPRRRPLRPAVRRGPAHARRLGRASGSSAGCADASGVDRELIARARVG